MLLNRIVPEYTRLFTDKFSAMNYAEKMNSKNLFSSGNYHLGQKLKNGLVTNFLHVIGVKTILELPNNIGF